MLENRFLRKKWSMLLLIFLTLLFTKTSFILFGIVSLFSKVHLTSEFLLFQKWHLYRLANVYKRKLVREFYTEMQSFYSTPLGQRPIADWVAILKFLQSLLISLIQISTFCVPETWYSAVEGSPTVLFWTRKTDPHFCWWSWVGEMVFKSSGAREPEVCRHTPSTVNTRNISKWTQIKPWHQKQYMADWTRCSLRNSQ